MVKNNKVGDTNFGKPKRDNFFTKTKPNFKKRNEQDNNFNKGAFKKSYNNKFNEEMFKPSERFKNSPFKGNLLNNGDKNKAAPSSSGDFFVKPMKLKEDAPSRKSDEKPEKRPFDKKQWRLKKYSKKYKLDQWEDKRKKSVLREYYKEVKDDGPKLDVKKIYAEDSENDEDSNDNENNLNTDINNEKAEHLKIDETLDVNKVDNSKTKRNKAFKKAHLEFERIKEEKNVKKEEIVKKKADKIEALKEAKKKKFEIYKKLNKKTKKGQPIMKDRMEMLLEQIQSEISTNF